MYYVYKLYSEPEDKKDYKTEINKERRKQKPEKSPKKETQNRRV
jgi:hypothetical protein